MGLRGTFLIKNVLHKKGSVNLEKDLEFFKNIKAIIRKIRLCYPPGVIINLFKYLLGIYCLLTKP